MIITNLIDLFFGILRHLDSSLCNIITFQKSFLPEVLPVKWRVNRFPRTWDEKLVKDFLGILIDLDWLNFIET